MGFVFHRPSPRYLDPGELPNLVKSVPGRLKKVGVFVNPPRELLRRLCRFLDIIQLHGDEPPDEVAAVRGEFGLPVIKALQIKEEKDLKLVDDFTRVADAIMLDAGMGGGRPFDWRLCRRRKMPDHWFLAGGINVYNVHLAAKSGATVLDVSGGVEDTPGKKSETKLKELITTVKNQ